MQLCPMEIPQNQAFGARVVPIQLNHPENYGVDNLRVDRFLLVYPYIFGHDDSLAHPCAKSNMLLAKQ